MGALGKLVGGLIDEAGSSNMNILGPLLAEAEEAILNAPIEEKEAIAAGYGIPGYWISGIVIANVRDAGGGESYLSDLTSNREHEFNE